ELVRLGRRGLGRLGRRRDLLGPERLRRRARLLRLDRELHGELPAVSGDGGPRVRLIAPGARDPVWFVRPCPWRSRSCRRRGGARSPSSSPCPPWPRAAATTAAVRSSETTSSTRSSARRTRATCPPSTSRTPSRRTRRWSPTPWPPARAASATPARPATTA